MSATTATLSPENRRFIWAIVIAQVLVQIGAFSLPALLPTYIASWNLSKTEAGWLVGIFFAAYVVAVPVLVSLTDRVPTRRVYAVGAALTALSHLGFAFVADGFWSGLILRALAGIGWAGAYMPGLKAIADTLEGNAQSRAVSMHAAGVGVAGASSFGIAGLIAAWFGPNAAFLFGGIAALVALAIAWVIMPKGPPLHAECSDPRKLLDFRPVFRNRPAMAWIAGYTVHTWEMAALRAWGVTFLTITAAKAGSPAWLPSPPLLFTIAGFVGIAVSISGNEMAQKFGRMRIVTLAIAVAAVLALVTGWTVGASMLLATAAGDGLDGGDLPRQLGADRRHRAGRRSKTARRHHGPAQHVRLCRRLHRPARRRPRAGSCRRQCPARLGHRLRPPRAGDRNQDSSSCVPWGASLQRGSDLRGSTLLGRVARQISGARAKTARNRARRSLRQGPQGTIERRIRRYAWHYSRSASDPTMRVHSLKTFKSQGAWGVAHGAWTGC